MLKSVFKVLVPVSNGGDLGSVRLYTQRQSLEVYRYTLHSSWAFSLRRSAPAVASMASARQVHRGGGARGLRARRAAARLARVSSAGHGSQCISAPCIIL